MEGELATPAGLYGGGRGAGGKFRKPSARRPPATPYDRPSASQSQAVPQRRNGGGWLSKLVDPACRLVASGATKIFPSLFSKTPSAVALPAPDTEDHDEGAADINQSADCGNQQCNLNLGISKSAGGTSPLESGDKLKSDVDFDQPAHGRISSLDNDTVSEFSKIELLVKGQIFSRDEIQRLREILNSMAGDTSNVEPEKKKENIITKEAERNDALGHETQETPLEEKQENFSRAALEALISPLQSNVEEVGTSPVDIARAFMGSRVSGGCIDSRRTMPIEGRASLHSDTTPFSQGKTSDFVSKPFLSPSCKSLVCWPGSMPQEHHGYFTPRSISGRYGIHYSSRSPYARTAYSKSRSSLQSDKKISSNFSSRTLLPPQTPLYGQSRGNAQIDSNGSVGPVRRLQHKSLLEGPSRGFMPSNAPQMGLSQVGDSSVFRASLPALKKNLELGASSSFHSVEDTTRGYQGEVSTLRETSNAVRTILEHLDRKKPTPSEKSAELKIATEWKNSPNKEADAMLKEHSSITNLKVFYFNRNAEKLSDKELSGQRNEDKGNSNVEMASRERSNNTADFVSEDEECSDLVAGHSDLMRYSNDSQVKEKHQSSLRFTDSTGNGTNKIWHVTDQINGQDAPSAAGSRPPTRPPFQLLGTKSTLASISVGKPDLGRTAFSDNSFGFTFPVSSSSAVLPEPPTPSVLPSSVTTGLPQEKDAIPSYTFGTKRSMPHLVFSFPSTSTVSMQDGAPVIKFTFGSDKNRLSFSSLGEDAICY